MVTLERTLHSIAVALDAAHLLAGWHADSGVLFVPALSEARVGDEVAVRIGISGQATRATVFGTIKLVRRRGRPSLPPGVEIVVDAGSLPAVQFLALAARAGSVDFRERPPRYLLTREIVVKRGALEVRCAIRNVSAGGCALAWAGAPPACGEVLTLLLRQGIFSATPRAIVCWASPDGSAPATIGLRVVTEGFSVRTWRGVVAEAAQMVGRAT